jgi:hypothetical protein
VTTVPNAEQRAMEALTKLNSIGFPEFTAKLIGDTVDAVIGSTIKQLKSYAELVAELEMGLESFKAKCVTDESAAQYLKEGYPSAGGDSAVAEGNTYDHTMYASIVNRLGPIDGLVDPGADTGTFTADNMTKIQAAVKMALGKAAEGSFEQLRILLQMGYARIVFTSGRIKSKLTFDVTTNDQRQRSSSDIAQSSFQASANMGGLLGAILGVSGSMSSRSFHVRTITERQMEADRVSADIMGEVEVNFANITYI